MQGLKNLSGVLTSPGETYRRLREDPLWLTAAVVLLLVAILGTAVAIPKIDFAEVTRSQMESSGRQMTEEQLDRVTEFYDKFGPVMTFAQAGLGLPIGWLMVALLMWVLIRMLGGIDLSFKQSFATTVNSMAPWLLHTLFSIPLLLGRSEIGFEELQAGGLLKHSLGHYLEAEGAMQQLLNSINVFSIWTVILLGIGFSVVGRVSKGKALGSAVGLWILGILIKVGLAGLQG